MKELSNVWSKFCTILCIIVSLCNFTILYSAEKASEGEVEATPLEQFDFDYKGSAVVFILYFDNDNSLNNAEQWLSKNPQKLLEVLDVPDLLGKQKIFVCKFASRESVDEDTKLNMYGTIAAAKERGYPVVMIVGGDSGGGFTELTNNPMLAPASIHSAILFDPKVGTGLPEYQTTKKLVKPFAGIVNRVARGVNNSRGKKPTINYDAIQGCVYNFYSKARKGIWRKFSPGTNGFVEGHSKIFNIRLIVDTLEAVAEDIKLFNEKQIFDADVLPVDLAYCAINDIKKKFQINSDLCFAKLPSVSIPTILPVFINRPVEVVGSNLVNRQEGWSVSLKNEDLQFVQRSISSEETRDALQKQKYKESSAVKEIHGHEAPSWWSLASLMQKIQRVQQNEHSQILSAFVVPAKTDEGVSIVAFAKSRDTNFEKKLILTPIKPQKGTPFNPEYSTKLGEGKDGYYYFMCKWRFRFDLNVDYEVIIESTSVNLVPTSVTLKIPEKNCKKFTFVVCGDVQKQNPEWLHSEDASGSAAKYFVDVYEKNENGAENPNNPILNLMVGDFVLDGSDLKDWGDIFGYLSKTNNGRMIAAAIGTHDFASSSRTLWLSLLGLKTKTAHGWKFAPAVPTFGDLFYFSQKPEGLKDGKLDPNEHVHQTQWWFDIGRVRFIHLPLATEEVNTYGDDANFAEWAWRNLRYQITGGFWFDFAIGDEFIRNLKKADNDRKANKLDFIIVYGHAPLVSAPNRHLHHKGLFNFYFENRLEEGARGRYENKISLAKTLLPEIAQKADAYFCGHNHVYDRCDIDIDINAKDRIHNIIPMVTIGLGTKLRQSNLVKGASESLQHTFPGYMVCKITSRIFIDSGTDLGDRSTCYAGGHNQFLPAYLKCDVTSGDDAQIVCKLMSRAKDGHEPVELDKFIIKKGERQFEDFIYERKYEDKPAEKIAGEFEPLETELPQLEKVPVQPAAQEGAEAPATVPAPAVTDLARSRLEMSILNRVETSKEPIENDLMKSRIVSSGTKPATKEEVTAGIPKADQLVILLENLAFALQGVEGHLTKEMQSKLDRIRNILRYASDEDLTNFLAKTNEHKLNILDIIVRSIMPGAIEKIVWDEHLKVFKFVHNGEIKNSDIWTSLLNLILRIDRFKNKFAIGTMRKLCSSCKTWSCSIKMRWLWARYYWVKWRKNLPKRAEIEKI